MRVGALVLIAALAFAAALALDVGGIQSRLFAEAPTKQREIAVKLPEPAAQKPAGPITSAWYLGATGYEGAELERQSAHANMVIYFAKRACEPCRRFERDVLASPEVKAFLGGVVKVRLDPGDGAAERKLAVRFGVSDVPAIAVVPRQGAPRLMPDRALSSPHLLVAFSR
jgi:thiol:disulfide interchange protein